MRPRQRKVQMQDYPLSPVPDLEGDVDPGLSRSRSACLQGQRIQSSKRNR